MIQYNHCFSLFYAKLKSNELRPLCYHLDPLHCCVGLLPLVTFQTKQSMDKFVVAWVLFSSLCSFRDALYQCIIVCWCECNIAYQRFVKTSLFKPLKTFVGK